MHVAKEICLLMLLWVCPSNFKRQASWEEMYMYLGVIRMYTSCASGGSFSSNCVRASYGTMQGVTYELLIFEPVPLGRIGPGFGEGECQHSDAVSTHTYLHARVICVGSLHRM